MRKLGRQKFFYLIILQYELIVTKWRCELALHLSDAALHPEETLSRYNRTQSLPE